MCDLLQTLESSPGMSSGQPICHKSTPAGHERRAPLPACWLKAFSCPSSHPLTLSYSLPSSAPIVCKQRNAHTYEASCTIECEVLCQDARGGSCNSTLFHTRLSRRNLSALCPTRVPNNPKTVACVIPQARFEPEEARMHGITIALR